MLYGGAPASSLLIEAQDGLANAQLVSGSAAGTAHVNGTAAPGVQGRADIAFQPGPPAAPLILTIYPGRVIPHGHAQVTLIVHDRFGNTVADGTLAHFGASRGPSRGWMCRPAMASQRRS